MAILNEEEIQAIKDVINGFIQYISLHGHGKSREQAIDDYLQTVQKELEEADQIKCDSCSLPIEGESFPVYDEQYNEVKGVRICKWCAMPDDDD